jgi:GAF domain-containing protein
VTSRLIASWRDGVLWPDDPALGLILQVDTLPMTQLWINSPNTPVFVTDSQSDPRIDPVNRHLAVQFEIRSVAIVPLYAAGTWQGVLTFLWSELHYFSSTEQFMLQRLLDPIASVVASRRAYAAQQETLANTEALYVASRRINEAIDLQEVLAAVAQVGAASIINRMVIFSFERDSTDEIEAMTVVAHWHNGQGYPPSPIGRRYTQADYVTVQLMTSREPLFFEDMQTDERVDLAFKAVAQQQNIRAMAVLPLRVGGRRLGALLLQSEEAYQFSERDIQIYLSLAPQIASTLENQRLLEETRAALATVEAIQRRYTIQTWSEYQAKSPVQGYQKVGEQILPLADEPLPVDVTPVVNHKQTLALPSNGDRLNRSEPAEVEEQQAQENVQASLLVPLTIRNEVIGVLGLQETESGREWQPEEIALVEAIAEQLALAAENIRLIDETQQRAARERRVNEIGEKIQAAQSLEEALQIAVREVGLSLQAPQTIVKLDVQ